MSPFNSECKWTEMIAFDNGDISSQKCHVFIALLFVLKCFCYQQIRLFVGIRNRFKKTKGGGRRRGRKPFSSSHPTGAPKRSFPALSAYKCLMLRLSLLIWPRKNYGTEKETLSPALRIREFHQSDFYTNYNCKRWRRNPPGNWIILTFSGQKPCTRKI